MGVFIAGKDSTETKALILMQRNAKPKRSTEQNYHTSEKTFRVILNFNVNKKVPCRFQLGSNLPITSNKISKIIVPWSVKHFKITIHMRLQKDLSKYNVTKCIFKLGETNQHIDRNLKMIQNYYNLVRILTSQKEPLSCLIIRISSLQM